MGLLAAARIQAWNNADVRAVAVLLLGFMFVLLLIPPARSFPITDDWIYAQSVTDLLKWDYKPHEYSQATSLTHIAIGAIFAFLFGQSFTVLSVANLLVSATCVCIFYTLLRHVNVTPSAALLGTALLAFNPLYVYTSYSFMTDITFLVCMLASCLCYIRGMQMFAVEGGRTASLRWLLVGSIAASLACLTRQFGFLLLPAALGYLWWSRTWTWQRAVAISGLPLAVTLIYVLWESVQPARLIDVLMNRWMLLAVDRPAEYLMQHLQLITWVLPALGLSLLPLIRFPKRPILALPLLAIIFLFQVRSLQQYGSIFPQNGNIVDHTGFVMYFYNAAPIWAESVWIVLGALGAVLVSLRIASYGEQAYAWLRLRRWRERTAEPVLMLYILAFLLGFVTFFISLVLFDRYLLPLLPLLMVQELRRLSASTMRTSIVGRYWRWALSLPLALFAVTAQRDYMAHSTARWQAAEQLVSQGASYEQVDAGFEWGGWHSFKAGADYIRERQDFPHVGFPPDAILDPAFVVADSPREGYSQIGSLPYSSWLSGGQTRRVLQLKRK